MSDLDQKLESLRRRPDAPLVVLDDGTVAAKSHDWWVRGRLARRAGTTTRAGAVLRPTTTRQVSSALAWANETRTPVVPFGLGSGVCGAVQADRDAIVLDMSAMSSILSLDQESLTVTVQPGMRGSDFERDLSARGFTMGHFPQSIELSTVGGWCSTRAAGQFSTLYGNIEDMVLGCEVVVPGGEVWRLPANVRASIGPDLKNVFVGSEGTLGVFSELTFRIHPLPEAREATSFRLADLGSGIEILRRVLRAGWRPAVTRLYDAIEAGRNFRVVGQGQPVLLMLSTGPEALVRGEAAAIAEVARALGAEALGREPVESWLEHRNQVPDIGALIEQGLVLDTIEVAAPWPKLSDLFDAVCTEGAAIPGMIAMSGHVSHCYTQGANIYFTFVATEADPERAVTLYDRAWELTMRHTRRFGGTIAHHHGIGRVRKPWLPEELGGAVELLRRLKRAIDPVGIMNPGVLID